MGLRFFNAVVPFVAITHAAPLEAHSSDTESHDSGAPERAWKVAIGAALTSTSGPAPKAFVTAAPSLGVEWATRTPWAPAVTLIPLQGDTTTVRSDRAARFRWSVVRLEASALGFDVGDHFGLRPTIVLDAGALESEGVTTRSPVLASDPWVAAGFGLHLRVRPVAPLFIDLGAAILANFTRGRYAFAGEDSPFFRIPAASRSLQMTVGAEL